MNKLLIMLALVTSLLNNYVYVDKEINIFKKIDIKEEKTKEVTENKKEKIIATYKGFITAYGPDCKGCSGITASGVNVRKTIYYHDRKYGKVRIVAADKKIPFGSIVRIKYSNKIIIAIVLDRGSLIGFNKHAYFDLLYKNEKESNKFGKKKATFEILRMGY